MKGIWATSWGAPQSAPFHWKEVAKKHLPVPVKTNDPEAILKCIWKPQLFTSPCKTNRSEGTIASTGDTSKELFLCVCCKALEDLHSYFAEKCFFQVSIGGTLSRMPCYQSVWTWEWSLVNSASSCKPGCHLCAGRWWYEWALSITTEMKWDSTCDNLMLTE